MESLRGEGSGVPSVPGGREREPCWVARACRVARTNDLHRHRRGLTRIRTQPYDSAFSLLAWLTFSYVACSLISPSRSIPTTFPLRRRTRTASVMVCCHACGSEGDLCRGQARHGEARHGEAGKTGSGRARLARLGGARPGPAGRGVAGNGKAGEARPGQAERGLTRHGLARQGGQGKAGRSRAGRGPARPVK